MSLYETNLVLNAVSNYAAEPARKFVSDLSKIIAFFIHTGKIILSINRKTQNGTHRLMLKTNFYSFNVLIYIHIETIDKSRTNKRNYSLHMALKRIYCYGVQHIITSIKMIV